MLGNGLPRVASSTSSASGSCVNYEEPPVGTLLPPAESGSASPSRQRTGAV